MAFASVRRYLTDNSNNNNIDNNKDKCIYGKMHTPDWWWIIQLAIIDFYMINATIMPILLVIDKIVLKEHARDMAQWLVYLTIGHLSHVIWRSRVRPEGKMVSFIHIHKGDLLSVKMEIYYKIIRVITKNTCNQ